MSTTLLQPYQMIGALYAGLVIGLLYSIFGIFRFALKKYRWCIYALDALFLIATLLLIEIALFVLCDGEFWVFMILGIAAGAILYGLTAHKLLKRIFYRIKRRLAK